jgi:hypothetical protein
MSLIYLRRGQDQTAIDLLSRAALKAAHSHDRMNLLG